MSVEALQARKHQRRPQPDVAAPSARRERSAAKLQSTPATIPHMQVGFHANETKRRDDRHAVAQRFNAAHTVLVAVRELVEAAQLAAAGKKHEKVPAVPEAVAGKDWAAPLARIHSLLSRKTLAAKDRAALGRAAAAINAAVPALHTPLAAQAMREMGLAELVAPTRIGAIGASSKAIPKRCEVAIPGGSIGGYSTALAAIEEGADPRGIVVLEMRETEEQTRRQGPGFDAPTLNFWKRNGVDTSFVSPISEYGIVMTTGFADHTFERRIAAMEFPESDETELHLGITSVRKAGTGRIFAAEAAERQRLLDLGVRIVNGAQCVGVEGDPEHGGTVQVVTDEGLHDVSANWVVLATGKKNDLLPNLGIEREKRVHSNRVNYYATFECDPALNKNVHVRVVHNDTRGMPLMVSFGSGKYRDVWVLNPTFGQITPEELAAKIQDAAPELEIKLNGGPAKLLGKPWRIDVDVDFAEKIVIGKGIVCLGDAAGSGDFLVGGGTNAAVAHAIAAGKLITGKISAAQYEARVRDITGQFHRLGRLADKGITLASAGNTVTTSLASVGKWAGSWFMPRSWSDKIVDGAWGAVHGTISLASGITLPMVTPLLAAALGVRR